MCAFEDTKKWGGVAGGESRCDPDDAGDRYRHPPVHFFLSMESLCLRFLKPETQGGWSDLTGAAVTLTRDRQGGHFLFLPTLVSQRTKAS